ncbi:MAG: putative membrane protein [Methanobacterium sp. Maddingley MBC34]|nr:MAG: putative membrane protein [Methanobacterium sp. Maddingley MBC34]
MIKGETIIFMGIAAVILGMVLIFIGTAFLSSGKTEGSENAKVSTGGVILIGPIPIIFGNDKSMVSIAVLGAVIVMIIAYILFYRGSL